MRPHAASCCADDHGRERACGFIRVAELSVYRNTVKTRVAEASLRDRSEFFELQFGRWPPLDPSLFQQFFPSHPSSLERRSLVLPARQRQNDAEHGLSSRTPRLNTR